MDAYFLWKFSDLGKVRIASLNLTIQSFFLSRNTDFITHRYKFISCNFEKKVRIVRQKVAITFFFLFSGGNGLPYFSGRPEKRNISEA